MHRLSKGVTGFFTHDSDPLPKISAKAFKVTCYAVVQTLDGGLEDFCPASYPKNYHLAKLHISYRSFEVYCNAHFPFIAFREAGEYVDAVHLKQVFEDLGGYQVLSQSILLGCLEQGLLEALGEVELQQVRYWKPGCVGDVIFNMWD